MQKAMMNKRKSNMFTETIIDRNNAEEMSLRESMQSLDIDGTGTKIQVDLKDGRPV